MLKNSQQLRELLKDELASGTTPQVAMLETTRLLAAVILQSLVGLTDAEVDEMMAKTDVSPEQLEVTENTMRDIKQLKYLKEMLG